MKAENKNTILSESETLASHNIEANNVENTEQYNDNKKNKHKKSIWFILSFFIVILIVGNGLFFGIRSIENKLFNEVQNLVDQKKWVEVIDKSVSGKKMKPSQILTHQADFDFYEGVAHYFLGDLDDAESFFKLAIESKPDLIEGNIYLAKIAFDHGDINTAKIYAEQARKRDDTQGYYYALQAYEFFLSNDYFEAYQAAQFALDRDEDIHLAHRIKGIISFWKSDIESSIYHLRKCIEINPTDNEAHSYLVMAYWVNNDFESAISELNVLTSYDSTSPTSLMAQALLKNNIDDPYKGFELIKKAYESTPTRHDIQFMYASLRPYQEFELENLQIFSKIYEENPQFIRAFLAKNLLLFHRYELTENINNVVDEIINLAPQSDYADLLLFFDATRRWDLDLALELINRMIEHEDNNPDFYSLRGALYLTMNRHDDARQDFETAKDFDPNPSRYYENIASLDFSNEEYDDALINAEKLLETNTHSISAKTIQAFAYLGQEELNLGNQLVEEILEIDPYNITCLLLQAQYALQENDTLKAMSAVNKAAEIQPKNPDINVFRGIIYLADSDYDHAYNEAQTAIKANSRNVDGYSVKASALLGQEKFREASNSLQFAILYNPYDESNYLQMGAILNIIEDYDDALKNLSDYVKMKPDDPQGYIARYYAYFGLGDTENALADLNIALTYEDELDIDDIEMIETSVKYLSTIPPLVDGYRHFEHENLEFKIAYTEDWLPSLVQYEEYLTYELNKGYDYLRITVSDPQDEGLMGLNPSWILQYFRQEIFSGAGINFVQQENFNIEGRYWLVDVYLIDPEGASAFFDTEVSLKTPITVKIYVYVQDNRWVAIEYIQLNTIDQLYLTGKATASDDDSVIEMIKTFEFLN